MSEKNLRNPELGPRPEKRPREPFQVDPELAKAIGKKAIEGTNRK